jgi:phosphoglycolate phosphatase
VKFEAVLFDLDGTLLNTLEDLGSSMNTVLKRGGFPTHALSAYRYFVGEGIALLAQRSLPATHRNDTTVAACVAAMSEEYAAHCTEATKPYPGILDMLETLAALKIRIAVLSNKPHHMTKLLVKHYFPSVSFDIVNGARPSVARKPDPAGALEIAGRFNMEPANMVYLGDSKTDMETATAAGMFPVGALWGFRDELELRQYGAKKVIAEPMELLKLF